MKKIILFVLLFFYVGLNQEVNANDGRQISSFSASIIGYFMSGGTEYTVWGYSSTNTIAKITWQSYVPPYTYTVSSPSSSGFWYINGVLSANVTFIDINGNTISYNNYLYQ